MKMNTREDPEFEPIPPDYAVVCDPVTISSSTRYRQLRLTVNQRPDESESKYDVRVWTVYTDGRQPIPHRNGLRLSRTELEALGKVLADFLGE